MSTQKTTPNDASVSDFINSVGDEAKRQDSLALLKLFSEATGEKPKMWGPSIIGFGSYHYKSPRSKQEGDWFKVGFSPRKQALTLYGIIFYDQRRDRLAELGAHTTGKGCLYIKRLSDVNLDVLREMIKHGYETDNPYGS